MSIAVKLRIKFGLVDDSSLDQIAAWSAAVAAGIARGDDPEEAGRSAAFDHFEGVDRCFYASEADSIMALLRALTAKT